MSGDQLEIIPTGEAQNQISHASSQATDLMKMAIEKGANIETIQALVDMINKEREYQAKIQFTEAMVAARAEFEPIVKRWAAGFESKKTGDKVNYKFEKIPDIETAVGPALRKNGFSYSWETEDSQDGKIRVTFILDHIGGHSRRISLSAAPDTTGAKNSLQAVGSSMSYLRRYTMVAGLGLSIGEDTDGYIEPETISAEQIAELDKLFAEAGTDIEKFCEYFKIDHYQELPVDKYGTATKLLLAAKRSKNKGGPQ